MPKKALLERFSGAATRWTGSSTAFAIAVGVIVLQRSLRPVIVVLVW